MVGVWFSVTDLWRRPFLHPPSNPPPVHPDWHTHPAVIVGESCGPRGLPDRQLRLASIWPDRESTSPLKNKSNNERTGGEERRGGEGGRGEEET